jgi:DnaJ-class molecular chaperone
MTQNKKFKQKVRERMARTGESYTTTRMHLLRERDRCPLCEGTGLAYSGAIPLPPRVSCETCHGTGRKT